VSSRRPGNSTPTAAAVRAKIERRGADASKGARDAAGGAGAGGNGMDESQDRWKRDCRFFEGERPCVHKRECPGCDLYSPMGRRFLVLKLAALGDVLRTTPILAALRESASPVHVTWVVGADAVPLLAGHPRIDRLWVPGWETSERLGVERFDAVLSLDKDAYSTSLATRVAAAERRGFGRDERGSLVALHPDSSYAYDLGLSDRLKFFENRRTYQDVVFEMCGLPWRAQEYDVPVVQSRREPGRARLARALGGRSGPVVGLNTGAGGVFANKAWTPEGYAELARRVAHEGCRVALLGGPDEVERNARIASLAGGAAVDVGVHPLPEFAGVVAACDVVVTGDTLGMHLAIAAKVPVVVLFGSTCPQEIELYGRGEKIVTPIECHPCYRRTCDIHPSCQELIPVERVHGAVQRLLAAARR
jgi:heptosyltransferase-2